MPAPPTQVALQQQLEEMGEADNGVKLLLAQQELKAKMKAEKAARALEKGSWVASDDVVECKYICSI